MNFKEYLQENVIDIDVIEKIESNAVPTAYNKQSGASGSMQIHNKGVWDEIGKSLNHNWDWDKLKFHRGASRVSGNHYINVMIPRYLQAYKLPDTTEIRLAAYNWGIGNVIKAYRTYGDGWIDHMPAETINYIAKYNKMVAFQSPIKTANSSINATPISSKSSIIKYKVKLNDNLGKISKLHKKTVKSIIDANPQIKNPNLIRPGQIINIPQ